MSNKKYELIPEGNMFRIRALRDIPEMSVARGEFGGLVSGEHNLDHSGDAWVSGDAQVTGYAWVSGYAVVSGRAVVTERATVSWRAEVTGDAWVSGNAVVTGDAQVSGNATVTGNAMVTGNAQVSGNMTCSTNPWTFYAGLHHVTVSDDHMAIGCQVHTIEHWHKNYDRIGKREGYSKEEIKLYGNLIKVVMGWRIS